MKCIIGLGNPGDEYKNTRHNTGFTVVDALSSKRGAEFAFDKKINSEIAKSENIIILKPHTFMNNSGKAVKTILKYAKCKPADLLVIHDDIDLNAFEYKLQFGRGSAGHKGVESIINNLKTKDFFRMRIGIAPSKKRKPNNASEYVLKKFSKTEFAKLNIELDKLLNIAQDWIKQK